MTIVTTNVFLAISDPTRREVLDLLATGSRKAGDIAARFRHLTQPAVSRHLKVLREAGLVNVEVNAQQRIYELKPEGLTELYEWVAKYQAMWPDTLEALARYLDARAVRQKPKGKKRSRAESFKWIRGPCARSERLFEYAPTGITARGSGRTSPSDDASLLAGGHPDVRGGLRHH